MPKVSKKPKAEKKVKEEVKKPVQEVIYPDITSNICLGEAALTAEKAKELMGWEVETDKVKFGSDFMLVDEQGNKVRCFRNAKNRQFTEAWSRRLMQDILNRHYKMNGEAIIIGKYGNVLSGQHRLVALILAEQTWAYPDDDHWKEKWPTPPTIESFVNFGIDEGPDTTRTLDNVKPRTLADVLFADESMFGKVSTAERAVLCRMCDATVKSLWDRTRAKDDAYAPRRTHSEALDFLDRHPRVTKAVKHINDENAKSAISRGLGINAGTAAALLYLMAACKSDKDKYVAVRTEKAADMSNWDKAQDFWTLLASGDKAFEHVRKALSSFTVEEEGTGSQAERTAIVIKAWNEFAHGGAMTLVNVSLSESEYETDAEGFRTFVANPVVGGIDGGAQNNVGESPKEEVEKEIVNDKEAREKLIKERHQKIQAKLDAERNGEAQKAEEYRKKTAAGSSRPLLTK